MASKKQSKALATVPPKGVAKGGWREQAAKSVAVSRSVSAKLPQQSGNFISFRGGSPSLGGASLPNPWPVILLAYGYERAYYSTAFQPDVLSSPDCYSYDGDAPHEKAKVPQADRCAECRFNEFGSAANAKGKGCKEGARFAIIEAVDSRATPEDIAALPIRQGRLSVLNSKAFRSYVSKFDDSDAPVWAGVSVMHVASDSKSQYAVQFKFEPVQFDEDTLDAIALRVPEADKLLIQPYPELDVTPKAVAKTAARAAPKRKF